MDTHLTRVTRVLPNRLAVQRIAAEANAKGIAFAAPLTGIAPDGEEIIGSQGASAAAPAAAAATPSIPVPRSVDNSQEPWFPPTGNQGAESSCVCWSETYYTTTSQVARLRGWDMKNRGGRAAFTPHFTYNQVNGGVDEGAWTTSAYMVAQTVGVPTFQIWPNGDSFSWPTEAAVWREALNFRMADAGSIANIDTPAARILAKQMLANGYILNYATEIFQWQFSSIQDDPATTADDRYFAVGVPAVRRTICTHLVAGSSGHEMTIVGYDDDIWCDLNANGVVDDGEKGAFRIINSWGAWQDGGCVWISYDALGATSAIAGGPNPTGRQRAFQANAVYWLKARATYEPTMVAEVKVLHDRRDQMQLGVGIGTTASPTPTRTWVPNMALSYCGGGRAFDGGTTAIPGIFLIDCTDLLAGATGNRLFAFMRDNAAGSPGAIQSVRFIDQRTGEVTLGAGTNPVGGMPQAMDHGVVYAWTDRVHAPPVAKTLRRETRIGTPVAAILDGADPNGRQLSYSVTSQPAHGSLSGNAPVLIYTPAAGFEGTDVFTFTVSNGTDASEPARVLVDVGSSLVPGLISDYYQFAIPPSTLPDVSTLPVTKATHHGTLSFTGAGSFPITSGSFAARHTGCLDVPTAGDYTLGLKSDDGSRLTVDGKVVIDADGVHTVVQKQVKLTLTKGLHPIQVDYFQNAGTASLSLIWIPPGAAGWSVIPAANLVRYSTVNVAPVVGDVAVAATSGGGISVPIHLVASDANQDSLTFTNSQPVHGTLFGSGPDFFYVADVGYVGTDAFTFQARDGALDSNLATVTITVSAATAINHAPVLTDQYGSTLSNRARVIGLAGSDADGDSLTYRLAAPPAHGAVTVSGASCTYTPVAGYAGKDSFTVLANDGKADSAPATIQVLVGAAVPGLFAEFFAIPAGTGVLPALGGLSPVRSQVDAQVNYTDTTFPSGIVDNVAIRYSGYLNVATPGSYTLSLSSDDGSKLWLDGVQVIANDGTHGVVKVSKTLTLSVGYHDLRLEYFQGGGGKSVVLAWSGPGIPAATIPVTALVCVPLVNLAPVAASRTLSGTPNTAMAITLGATDADGDALTYQVLTQPIWGTLTGTSPALTYHPPVDYQGDDQFTFCASDGRSSSNIATVSVHLVSPGNAAPTVAVAAGTSSLNGTTAQLRCLGADDGLEQGLIYTWTTAGTPPAPVSFSPNGTNGAKVPLATFTKAGSYAVICTITDAGGLSVASPATVVVASQPGTVAVGPAAATIAPFMSQPFTVQVRDQFGDPLVNPPAPVWTVAAGAGGTVGADGAFTSDGTTGGPWTITGMVNGIASTATITVAMEARAAFVTRFYQNCLNRNPDAAGLTAWVEALRTKAMGGTDVARGFVRSPEFIARGLGDGDFLDVLYRSFFNRAADPAGKSAWQAELAKGVLREDVLYGFILAPEFATLCDAHGIVQIDALGLQRYQVRQFVRRFYLECLGREPDAAGIDSWTRGLIDGTSTGGDIARGFVLSPEFIARSTSNSLFLDILYSAFFARSADAGGKSAWSVQLGKGTSRASVLDGFIRAQEFVALCGRYGIIPFSSPG